MLYVLFMLYAAASFVDVEFLIGCYVLRPQETIKII